MISKPNCSNSVSVSPVSTNDSPALRYNKDYMRKTFLGLLWIFMLDNHDSTLALSLRHQRTVRIQSTGCNKYLPSGEHFYVLEGGLTWQPIPKGLKCIRVNLHPITLKYWQFAPQMTPPVNPLDLSLLPRRFYTVCSTRLCLIIPRISSGGKY